MESKYNKEELKRKLASTENLKEELIEIYADISDTVEQLTSKIESLVKSTSDSKNFRRMIYEKELTQLLSGFTQLQKLKVDIIKELHKMNEQNELDDNPLFKLLQESSATIEGNDQNDEFPMNIGSE